jgi:hypothetical protein
MSSPSPHNPKIDAPTGQAQQIAKLQAAWRLRFQLGHAEVDPLPRPERLLADLRLATKRCDADHWLIAHRAAAEMRQRMECEQVVRSRIRVIAGGRR